MQLIEVAIPEKHNIAHALTAEKRMVKFSEVKAELEVARMSE